MEKIKLNICSSEGDPTNPRTWSGTPFHLYSELKEMECLGSAFNSVAVNNKYVRRLFQLTSKLYYGNSFDWERGLIARSLNAEKAKREASKSESNLTLHTGTLDLPFLKLPKGQKHYLFSDSTWNLWSSQATNMQSYTKKLWEDAEKLEKKAYSQMEHIFSISEYVKDNLITHYGVNPKKITVVGTGLGVIKPYYGQKDYSNNKILFTAKDRFEDKGGPLVLEAFKRASEKNPNLELTIVGRNEYTQKIDLPNVKTYGFIPLEDLQTIFNESSLFLMPAVNEPWGLVYLEALACKTPIVGLNRNSFPELSGNSKYGFGLDEADPVRLSEILVEAFQDPQKLTEKGDAGQKFCLENFSWSHTVTKIIKTIEVEKPVKLTL
jgi:glycosyltransferase involved in cell wall biosynthesis